MIFALKINLRYAFVYLKLILLYFKYALIYFKISFLCIKINFLYIKIGFLCIKFDFIYFMLINLYIKYIFSINLFKRIVELTFDLWLYKKVQTALYQMYKNILKLKSLPELKGIMFLTCEIL